MNSGLYCSNIKLIIPCLQLATTKLFVTILKMFEKQQTGLTARASFHVSCYHLAQSSPKLEPWIPVHQNLAQQPKITHIFNTEVRIYLHLNLIHQEHWDIIEGDNKKGEHENMHFFKTLLSSFAWGLYNLKYCNK